MERHKAPAGHRQRKPEVKMFTEVKGLNLLLHRGMEATFYVCGFLLQNLSLSYMEVWYLSTNQCHN